MAGEVERLYILFDADGRPYARGLRDIENETNRSARTVSDRWDRAGKQIVTSLKWAAVAGAAAIAGIGVASVKVAADFEYEMSRIKANADGTAQELQQLEAVVLQLGKDTAFSAGEAAQAANELVKAGLTMGETMAALPGMLDLAAAGELGVAQAATITAQALNAFELEAKDATTVADILAATANKSTTEVANLGQGLATGASIAQQANMSFADFNAVLGIMSNNGVEAAEAGTMLKTMFTQIMAPTAQQAELMEELGFSIYDTTGKVKPMVEIIRNLETSLEGATQEQRNYTLATLFGSRGIVIANTLLKEGSEEYARWTEAVSEAGFAQDVAATKMDNLRGSWEEFTGALETAAITMGKETLGPLRGLLEELTTETNDFVDAWNRMTGTDAWQQGGFEVKFDMAADTIMDTFESLLEKAGEAIQDVDWDSIGRTLSKIIVGALDTLVPMVFESLVPAAAQMAAGVIENALKDAPHLVLDVVLSLAPTITGTASGIYDLGAGLASAMGFDMSGMLSDAEKQWMEDWREKLTSAAEVRGITTAQSLIKAVEEGYTFGALTPTKLEGKYLAAMLQGFDWSDSEKAQLLAAGFSFPGSQEYGQKLADIEAMNAADQADFLYMKQQMAAQREVVPRTADQEDPAFLAQLADNLERLQGLYESIVSPADAWNQTLSESKAAAEEAGSAWEASAGDIESYIATLDEQLAAWETYEQSLKTLASTYGDELGLDVIMAAAERGPEFVAALMEADPATVEAALRKTYDLAMANLDTLNAELAERSKSLWNEEGWWQDPSTGQIWEKGGSSGADAGTTMGDSVITAYQTRVSDPASGLGAVTKESLPTDLSTEAGVGAQSYSASWRTILASPLSGLAPAVRSSATVNLYPQGFSGGQSFMRGLSAALSSLTPFVNVGVRGGSGTFDEGGMLPPGVHLVGNFTGRPEPVLTPNMGDDLRALVDGLKLSMDTGKPPAAGVDTAGLVVELRRLGDRVEKAIGDAEWERGRAELARRR